MTYFEYTIQSEQGIHARPAGLLVKEASQYPCDITILFEDKKVDAKKIFGVMGLGLKPGDVVRVECQGEQEEQAAAALEEFFKQTL